VCGDPSLRLDLALCARSPVLAQDDRWLEACGAAQSRALSRQLLKQEIQTRYFSVKTALTWAVTVTFWGVKSSVGAGVAGAFAPAAMARAMRGMTTL